MFPFCRQSVEKPPPDSVLNELFRIPHRFRGSRSRPMSQHSADAPNHAFEEKTPECFCERLKNEVGEIHPNDDGARPRFRKGGKS